MKHYQLEISLLSILLCAVCLRARSQGTFQNLSFEAATLIPIPADIYDRVQFAPAFPGWNAFVGGEPQSAAQYNSAFLDSSGICIIDSASVFPPGTDVIEGTYTAVLVAGFQLGTFQPADTTLAQTGLVPPGAQSLHFSAHSFSSVPGTFQVTFGGQALPLIPIQSGPNGTLYGADIHAWAGQSGTLAFTAFAERPHVDNNYFLLDAIGFSDQRIPEPTTFGLVAVSALVLGWRSLHTHRPSK